MKSEGLKIKTKSAVKTELQNSVFFISACPSVSRGRALNLRGVI